MSFELELPGAGPPDALAVDAPASSFVARELRASGLATYEPEALACFLAALEAGPPGAVLDVGANIGLYAFLAAARSARTAVAFRAHAGPRADRGAGRPRQRPGRPRGAPRPRACAGQGHVLPLGRDGLLELARPGLAPLLPPAHRARREPRRMGRAHGTGARRGEDRHGDDGARRAPRGARAPSPATGRGSSPRSSTASRRTGSRRRSSPSGTPGTPIRGEAPCTRERQIVGDPGFVQTMWLFAPAEPGDAFWSAVRTWRAALATCHAPGTRGSA